MDNFNQGNFNQQGTNGHGPDYTLWFVLGIIQICLICCCNIFTCICGIVTVVMIKQADEYFRMGNYTMYQARVKSAKIANIIGWALIVLGTVFSMVSGVFTTIADKF